jgi:nucleotide-binding universal stress UspA family protein
MSLRDIVVFLDALPASEERLRLATHVARNHRAHLGVVFVHDDQAVAEASGIVAGYGLMHDATTVSMMTIRVRDEDLRRDHEASQRVVRHLARHKIPARADRLLRNGDAIPGMLLSAAMDISADLIVAGAQHHSPLREALTRGVSRELLQHMTVPVLMSH